jgi:ABC-2 type transport system ATP-binding protein
VSFDLAEGGVRVLGLNGAGKPTTLRTRMGLLRPTAGEATIAAPDCWSSATRARQGRDSSAFVR